jgi:hypothetical protein
MLHGAGAERESGAESGAGAERERFREREHRERHFPKILGSRASWERLLYIYIYIYIYYVYIQQKHAKKQISCKIYENMHICACR